MKIRAHLMAVRSGVRRVSWPSASMKRPRRGQDGVSLLVILALLACMAIMVAANSTALASLKQHLILIDWHQQKKYGQSVGH